MLIYLWQAALFLYPSLPKICVTGCPTPMMRLVLPWLSDHHTQTSQWRLPDNFSISKQFRRKMCFFFIHQSNLYSNCAVSFCLCNNLDCHSDLRWKICIVIQLVDLYQHLIVIVSATIQIVIIQVEDAYHSFPGPAGNPPLLPPLHPSPAVLLHMLRCHGI